MDTIKHNTEWVECEHIRAASDSNRIIAVVAGCGMGKSTACRRWLRTLDDPPTIAISCRINHAVDLTTQYKLADYRNKDTIDEREIATTINSLGKYDKWYKEYATTGCLILDEIRSILPVIDSPTLQDDNATADLIVR